MYSRKGLHQGANGSQPRRSHRAHPANDQIHAVLAAAMAGGSISNVHRRRLEQRRISWHGIASTMLAFVVYDLGFTHVIFETEIVVHGTGEYLHTDAVP